MSREVCFEFLEVVGGTIGEQSAFLSEVAAAASVAEPWAYTIVTPTYFETWMHYSNTVQYAESLFYDMVEGILKGGNHPTITSVKTLIKCRDHVTFSQ